MLTAQCRSAAASRNQVGQVLVGNWMKAKRESQAEPSKVNVDPTAERLICVWSLQSSASGRHIPSA
jgi:hypothetical protein